MLRNFQYLVGDDVDRQFEGRTLKEYVEGIATNTASNIVGLAPEELDTPG